MPGRDGLRLPVKHFVHVEDNEVRQRDGWEFTISVKGAYQLEGPHGTIALVGRPAALLAAMRSTSSDAITRPISVESLTRRKGTRVRCEASSSSGIEHQRRRLSRSMVPIRH